MVICNTYKTNEDCHGGMKQMWVRINGILGQREGKADTGIAALKAMMVKWLAA